MGIFGKHGKEMVKDNKIVHMCVTAALTALVFVVTAYLHIPTNHGYIHVGDGLIYLAACMLPRPYAVTVGAVGALLADCLTGYVIWAPGSVIIKALTALLFSCSGNKIIRLRNMLMILPAAVLCAGGYYLYEAIIYGNYVAPLAGIPASLTQSLFSTLVFIGIGLTIDKTNIKARMNGGHY